MRLKLINIIFLISLLTATFYVGQAQNIYTAVGNGSFGFSGDGGPANLAQVYYPQGMVTDALGNIYFCDTGNSRIRKISTTGTITTIAGTGSSVHSGDGGPATLAQLCSPSEIAIDALGNLYITEACGYVRKINTSGTISTIAGVGGSGYLGDGGPATSAVFNTPTGIALDASGNIYIVDTQNSCVRKINSSGIISTIVGNGFPAYSGDGGPAISAQLFFPWGVAIDAIGNIYIADKASDRIRKIDGAGIINTVIGTGVGGYNGDGILATTAKISAPADITFDVSGNLYFTERGGMRVRKVNTSGIINTIAGNGINGYAGDGGPATSAQFNLPVGITFDANGNIYVSDPGDARIRIICNTSCLAGIKEYSKNGYIKIYPNPVSNTLFIPTEQNEFENSDVEIVSALGQIIFRTPYKPEIDVAILPQGFYTLKITTLSKQTYNSKFIKE